VGAVDLQASPVRAALQRASRTPQSALAAAVALGALLIVHGYLPGLVNTSVWNFLLEGDMRCMADKGIDALTSWCQAYGQPAGYPFLTSGPIVFLGWALMQSTGMGSHAAYALSGAAFDALALWGAYGLLRLLGVRRSVAVVAAVAYLASPTIVGLRDFGGTFTGIALLPALAWCDLMMIRAVERGERARVAVAAGGYAAARIFILFMDGYAFTLSALVAAALWLWWLALGRAPVRTRLLGATVALGAQVVAVAIYRWYAPPIAGPDPIGAFRSMGVDLTTLVAPTRYIWGADLLGWASDHTQLWGDGTNSTYNYVGVLCAVLAGAAVIARWRQPYVPAFAAAGIVGLVLSLGPALKIDDVRGPLPERAGPASYVMPASEATLEFPWDRVYRIPGPAQMRATYRWSAVTRLALIALAAIAVNALLDRRRWRVVVIGLALVALVEMAPNVPLLVSQYRDHDRSRATVDATLIPEVRAAVGKDDSVFFVSPDGVYNDYLVNYLAPTVGFTTYNAGGDKNEAIARNAWPPPIADLAEPDAGADQVLAALRSRAVSVVVAPYFHLLWDAYQWPPSESSRQATVRRFASVLADRRLSVRRYHWFATLRLAR
jgi:hypothetical protein